MMRNRLTLLSFDKGLFSLKEDVTMGHKTRAQLQPWIITRFWSTDAFLCVEGEGWKWEQFVRSVCESPVFWQVIFWRRNIALFITIPLSPFHIHRYWWNRVGMTIFRCPNTAILYGPYQGKLVMSLMHICNQ